MHYYTYAYLREDRTPYYIGKGTGKRIYSKNKTIKPPKDKSRIIYLKQNLTEAEAFRHEIYMIDVFGRKDLGTGILHNLTDGGGAKTFYANTNVVVGNNLTVVGNTTITGDLTVTGNITLDSLGFDDLAVNGSVTI